MNKDLIIDSHAHLNFEVFNNDFKQVIEKSLKNNVWIINIGSQYETSKKAVNISCSYNQGVFACVGLHPIHTINNFNKNKENKQEFFNYQDYKQLALSKKVVAIGETGLDYYYKPKNRNKKEVFKQQQKEVFKQHLKLAKELKLPVILHCRMAHQDLIDILKKEKIKGVMHCFTGNWQEAEQYLKMGLYIGFTGIIFKIDLSDVISKTPLNRILIETDCPYLSPYNKDERNEPLNVKQVALEIARIKKIDYEQVRQNSVDNTKKLFNI